MLEALEAARGDGFWQPDFGFKVGSKRIWQQWLACRQGQQNHAVVHCPLADIRVVCRATTLGQALVPVSAPAAGYFRQHQRQGWLLAPPRLSRGRLHALHAAQSVC